MRWIVLAILTAVVLAALTPLRRRRNRPRPRSVQRPASQTPRRAPRLRIHRSGALRWHHRGDQPNPFEVLRVQTRLGIVADEVRMLEQDQNVYARAHHLEATQKAYDALLAEACMLAGVDPDPHASRGDEQERFREEVELTSRGWSW